MARILMINGKGGVGKTTTSSAIAVWLAKQGYKTLLLSTDPAASVGDCLNLPIGNEVVPVTGVENLWAMEIDGRHEYKKLWSHLQMHAKKYDIEKFLPEHGAPGMNELSALFRAFTFVYNLKYDIIVIDTAPTGHTLDMLRTPEMLQETMNGIKSVIKSLNTIKNLFTMTTTKNTNRRLDTLIACAGHVGEILSDKSITHFNLTSTAEFMALREEVRAYNDFSKCNVYARNIILNMIQPDMGDCSFCTQRRKNHLFYIEKMKEQFADTDVDILEVELYAKEPVGVAILERIGSIIMHQMQNLEVAQSYRVVAQNGTYNVYTELPFLEPEYLLFNIEGNVLYMTIDYGLHENIENGLSFKRPIRTVKPLNNNGKLMLQIGV